MKKKNFPWTQNSKWVTHQDQQKDEQTGRHSHHRFLRGDFLKWTFVGKSFWIFLGRIFKGILSISIFNARPTAILSYNNEKKNSANQIFPNHSSNGFTLTLFHRECVARVRQWSDSGLIKRTLGGEAMFLAVPWFLVARRVERLPLWTNNLQQKIWSLNLARKKKKDEKQDKVNSADSAFILLII